ncbi:hypothetical protein [Streptomyces sp. NBC_01618]|nr:hypothetical protein OH735_37710 [Streptomyces sp. NBC_01618]
MAVDAAVQQLLIAVHPISFPAAADNEGVETAAGPAWCDWAR